MGGSQGLHALSLTHVARGCVFFPHIGVPVEVYVCVSWVSVLLPLQLFHSLLICFLFSPFYFVPHSYMVLCKKESLKIQSILLP